MRRSVLRFAEVCGPHNIDLSPQPERSLLPVIQSSSASANILNTFNFKGLKDIQHHLYLEPLYYFVSDQGIDYTECYDENTYELTRQRADDATY